MFTLSLTNWAIIGLLILAGLGVLIWWLVTDTSNDKFETILLETDGLGQVKYNAAYTRIYGAGDIFWWFFPSTSDQSRPILLFLGGVTGIPDSFLLNFGGIGPLDFNLNTRNTSLVSDYHLLFVDSLLGTGFSQLEDEQSILTNLSDMVDNLIYTLQSFYGHNDEYEDAPLYIYAQGDASHLAIPLTTRLLEDEDYSHKIKGIFLGNPTISPALTLTKLGFYLEELAYVDGNGRAAIEEFSTSLSSLVSSKNFEEAFNQFFSLGEFINERAGAVAVNVGYIVEKLTRNSVRDYFGLSAYRDRVIPSDINMKSFMEETIAPALGISNDNNYDEKRDDVIKAFRPLYMEPIVDKYTLG
ncbi:retinoid-inducible serine carboxypeptidase-like [Zerene cesonia]|uniref:retinoid-inducible serine carboxypeptidase-like n=1 Tax=Zerene cesonia TaxID=33412 RepID=UPI0018E4FF30|nr:retinoid-inducible serine carboxypeptidase-like [Zerene cesonia]